MTNQTLKAWHFVGDTLRDRSPIPKDGEWLTHDGQLVMCQSGLHASKRLIDALGYAPGSTICRVEVKNAIQQSDKLVAHQRKILWRIDGTDTLRRFAWLCALDVIHLWDAPEIVVDYLKTGDETKQVAASAAASVAAWGAARGAPWAASRAAARAAARAASWAAATAAARGTAKAASWAAATAAAREPARAASWGTSWETARAAARAKQNKRLTSMVTAAHHKQIGSP